MSPSSPGSYAPVDALPLRRSQEVQGNVLAAFNKDHQTFLLLQLPESPAAARAWLAEVAGEVATTDAVETFNEAFSAARHAAGGDPQGLQATWVALSLTYPGLQRLLADTPAAGQLERDLETAPGFEDALAAFRAQPHERAGELGDTDESAPEHWVFGGPEQPVVHAVLTVAADRDRDREVKLRELATAAARHGVLTVFELHGATLPERRRGHEHFGFKDGISQPGVREFHEADGDERAGHPGTKLVQPGEFVLGHPDEHERDHGQLAAWLHDGSFQVLRRLTQDVAGWWSQVQRARQGDGGREEDRLGAKFVGRWRSGTPLAHQPDRDGNPAQEIGSDNDFDFGEDQEGVRTPRFAHIRKMYPRGQFEDNRHRIMRRGIPFGEPFDPAAGPGQGVDAERGLVFNAFCADLAEQFEFLQRAWANNPGFPPREDRRQDGPDPVIGTDGTVKLVERAGAEADLPVERLVHTTGAVYAFAPSLPTLRRLAEGGL